MKDSLAVEDFLREKIKIAVAPRTKFSIGTVVDESFCLIFENSEWIVGFAERGILRPEAKFSNPVSAAKYLILLMLDKRGPFTFPHVDWTGFASLPESRSIGVPLP